VPFPIQPSTAKRLFGNLAQSSHYEVRFQIPSRVVSYLARRGVSPFYCTSDFGLLCTSTILPTSAFATSEVTPYVGIREKIAHTRMYNNIVMEFYVDSRYDTIKVLEHWMDFISSGSDNTVSKLQNDYFIRMQYPDDYKSSQTKIIKFDRDYNREIEYTFRGMFPQALTSIPVSYAGSDVLKVSATFEYDRYIAGKTTSIAHHLGIDENKDPVNRPRRVPMTSGQSGTSGVVFRPANLSATEAVVQGELYTSLHGDTKAI
jgi:hypothetical protein